MNTFIKLKISLSSIHRILKNGTIWNNIPVKKSKRSGDNSNIDEPSRYVYMDKGSYLMTEVKDINRFQNKLYKDDTKRISFIDKIKQKSEKCKYTATITKIFAKTGYCKIPQTAHEIWFHKNNINNTNNNEWEKLTVGTTMTCNIVNQRNQLKATNIELLKYNINTTQIERSQENQYNNRPTYRQYQRIGSLNRTHINNNINNKYLDKSKY